jgi:branched-chain amino acid transport system ATP-binding protein
MLNVTGLDVAYGEVQVLWDVNLTVSDGEIVALVGSNSAGKTTILNTLSGLLQPMRGSIEWSGENVTGFQAADMVARGIIQVPEGRKLFSGMTVNENLTMGAYLRKDRAAVKRDADWIYGVFPELAERRGQLAGTMSGGQQQMCAIGRALMGAPKLLLVDELSLGLAPVVVDRLAILLRKIQSEMGISILLVEQDIQVAMEIAQRGYVIETGRVFTSGASAELLANPKIIEAYLGM